MYSLVCDPHYAVRLLRLGTFSRWDAPLPSRGPDTSVVVNTYGVREEGQPHRYGQQRNNRLIFLGEL